MACLIHVVQGLFLFAAGLNGVGAALLWTSQGTLLSGYSTADSHGRLSGVFWGMLQCSLLFGALFLLVIVPGGTDISKHTATSLYTALTVVCGCGSLLLLALPPAHATDVARRKSGGGGTGTGTGTGTGAASKPADLEQSPTGPSAAGSPAGGALTHRKSPHHGAVRHVDTDPLMAGDDGAAVESDGVLLLPSRGRHHTEPDAHAPCLSRTWFHIKATFVQAFTSRPLQQVLLLTFYSGMALTFLQGKMGEILSGKDSELSLPSAFKPRLVSWQLLATGVADISGGILFGRASDHMGLFRVVLFSTLLPAILAVAAVFINFLHPAFNSVPLAFVAAAMWGFGDAGVNTLTTAALCKLFGESEAVSSRAFAANFCVKSLGAGIAFAYSGHIPLAVQLGLLLAFLLAGTATFSRAVWALPVTAPVATLPSAA